MPSRLESSSIEHHEEATRYYKEQSELISYQKQYAAAITRASNVTMIATVVMAFATIAISVIGYLQYSSSADNRPQKLNMEILDSSRISPK